MAAYQVQNYQGGPCPSWIPGSTWLLGSREDQYLVEIDIRSRDCGRTLRGTVTYNGEGPIELFAEQEYGNMYNVKVRWGGSSGTWHDEGIWVIGGRCKQRCTRLKVTASDDGRVLVGVMNYSCEKTIGFVGIFIPSYEVENQWGGSSAPWHYGGTWVLSGRTNQNVVAMDIKSTDGGCTLEGTMTYKGEGPIGFRAVNIVANNYEVYNQWGGSSAPWHRSGDMIIGGRETQRVIELKFNSNNNGQTLNGQMKYEGEGPIGFRAKIIDQIK